MSSNTELRCQTEASSHESDMLPQARASRRSLSDSVLPLRRLFLGGLEVLVLQGKSQWQHNQHSFTANLRVRTPNQRQACQANRESRCSNGLGSTPVWLSKGTAVGKASTTYSSDIPHMMARQQKPQPANQRCQMVL